MKPTIQTNNKPVGNAAHLPNHGHPDRNAAKWRDPVVLKQRGRLLFAFWSVFLTCAVSPLTRAQDCPTNCDGNGNSALGIFALQGITTGTNNTAIGQSALEFTSSSGDNTGIGVEALADGPLASGTSTTERPRRGRTRSR